MARNTFGKHFRITTFGESHGPAMGVVIDGCPAGVHWNEELLLFNMQRRRPGFYGGNNESIVSSRKEEDLPRVLSGIYEGKTLGTPITLVVENKDTRSKDYDEVKKQPRPGHADDVWRLKFGHVDHRGGGRSSGRETVSRVMAGSVAEMFLQQVSGSSSSVQAVASAKQIAQFKAFESEHFELSKEHINQYVARLPQTEEEQKRLHDFLLLAKEKGKSYGGLISLKIMNVPAGLGQPVFHKLKSDLASALMSIGAVVGVELGDGFLVSDKEGSEFHKTETPSYGGIRGGISTGEVISFNIAVKPTSSVLDVAKKGRHDPCIVPRAIPVIEAMASIVIADHFLWQRMDQI